MREAKIYATGNKLDDAKARLVQAERDCKWWSEVVQDLEAELVIVKVE